MRRGPLAIVLAILVAALAGCERPSPPAGAPSTPAVSVGRVDDALAAAEQYLGASDLIRAETILLALVQRVPDEPRGHEMLGRVRLIQATQARDRGDAESAAALFEAAYASYRSATDLAPDDAGLQHSAGEVAQAAGRLESALDHYRRAAALEPTSSRHLVFEAQVLLETGRLDEAASSLDRAAALDPGEPLVHASIALVALRRGDGSLAIERIGEARRLAPADVGIRVIEARIHREAGSPRRSVEMLSGLDPRQRQSEAVVAELAEAYEALDDPAAAARAWQAFYYEHANEPGAWRAAIRAAGLLLEAGERAEAGAWLDRARATAPGAPEVAAVEAALGGAR